MANEADLQRLLDAVAHGRAVSMNGADLSGANLRGLNLKKVSLENADLRGADLRGANLPDANLYGADLSHADISDADLSNAELRHAALIEANLSNADLSGADLRYVDLSGANLSGANLTRTNLYTTDFTGANLTDAKMTSSGTLASARALRLDLPGGLERRKALGKHASPILKLGKHGAMPAREFKRRFPAEFERIKPLARGRDFSQEVQAELITVASGPEWAVFAGYYTSISQRLCDKPNNIILLGIDVVAALPEHVWEAAEALAETSMQSYHPAINRSGYLTVGWVRYCNKNHEVWLVEEVQSDLIVMRHKRSEGIIERYEELIKATKPWLDRFYEDAMAILFDYAQQAGAKVEMLTYESKESYGSPRSVYEDLPRRMGMTRAPESAVLPGHPVWEYTPNRARYGIRKERI